MCLLLNILLSLLCLTTCPRDATEEFDALQAEFAEGYGALQIPFAPYDYRDELRAIPGSSDIKRERQFFQSMQEKLSVVKRGKLPVHDRLQFDHLQYEVKLNLTRLKLDEAWNNARITVPADGLSSLPMDWYQYRIARFTSIDITPDQLFAFGEAEVTRVKGEIARLRKQLGFENDSIGFYQSLQGDAFFLTDKDEILARYAAIMQKIRKHLDVLFLDTDVSDVQFMEWQGADRFTPPGYYSPAYDNAYGIPVFHFNFYNKRHNTRSMEWLFMHEAIPGHHYQWWMREGAEHQVPFKAFFSYPGNFEGWAAYVEYLGKDLGMYTDPYSELGKWEWDLVRSARILIDVGIHAYGWSHEQALECWKKHIPGQDEIAEREVTRCTNWPGQALSYKVGAWRIQQMIDRLRAEDPAHFSLPAFHHAYLSTGQTPLAVIEQNIDDLLRE